MLAKLRAYLFGVKGFLIPRKRIFKSAFFMPKITNKIMTFSKYQQDIIRNIIKKTKHSSFSNCTGESILIDEFEKNGILAISWEEDFSSVNFYGTPDNYYEAMLKINEIVLLFDNLKRDNLVLFQTCGYSSRTEIHSNEVQKIDCGNGVISYRRKEDVENNVWKIDGGKSYMIHSESFGKKIKEIANASIFPSYSLKKLCNDKFRTIEQEILCWTRVAAIIAFITFVVATLLSICSVIKMCQ